MSWTIHSINQEPAKWLLKSLKGLSCQDCPSVLAVVGFALNAYFEKKELTVQDSDIDEMVAAETKWYEPAIDPRILTN